MEHSETEPRQATGKHGTTIAELREAFAKQAASLREAKEFAEHIISTIPDGLLVLDANLRVQTANDSFYALFQVSPAETKGRLIYELGNGQWDIPELHALLEEVLPQNNVFTGYEVEHYFEGLGRRIMRLNGRYLDHVQFILLAITDITEGKQAEEALRRSEENYRLLVENAQEYAIFMLTTEGCIERWNNGAERIFGYREEEAIGLSGAVIFTEDDRTAGVPEMEMLFATHNGQANDDRWQLRRDGSRFWASGVMEALRHPDGQLRGFVKVLRDNTEQKRTEEAWCQLYDSLEAQVEERTRQVRQLVSQLTLSEQAERRRISEILHEDLQQRLHSFRYQLTLLRHELGLGNSEDARQRMAAMEAELKDTIGLTRNLSIELSPPALEGEGLKEAFQWLSSQMQEQHGLRIHLQAADVLPVLSADLRVLLFRIVREVLFNVVKHAGVKEATVVLSYADAQVRIEIIDQGQGFDAAAVLAQPDRSDGLWRSQRRLELIGGQMQIDSTPETGTRVMLTCPLSPRNAA